MDHGDQISVSTRGNVERESQGASTARQVTSTTVTVTTAKGDSKDTRNMSVVKDYTMEATLAAQRGQPIPNIVYQPPATTSSVMYTYTPIMTSREQGMVLRSGHLKPPRALYVQTPQQRAKGRHVSK